ncbi:MAG: hypothetical protein JXM79_09075 [Sedimentisphaerales bacterium]|nr:hypothetical protein [Sedimentisphaerales bacterium]
MAKKTVQEDKLKGEKSPRNKWIKMVVPSVLLFLVLAFIAVVALSSPLRTALDNDNVVIFILTGLLYTLIAVWLMLTVCADGFKKMEENIQSVATDIILSRIEQHRMGNTSLKSIEEVGKKLSLLEENQHILRNLAGTLKEIVEKEHHILRQTMEDNKQGLANDVAAVLAGQTTMNEALQSRIKAVDAQISALTADQEQFESNINALQDLIQTASTHITNIVDEQAGMQQALQSNAEALQAELNKFAEIGRNTATSIEAITTEQTALREALENKIEETSRNIATLSESQHRFQNNMKDLGEKANDVASEVANLITQQATMSEILKTHSETSDNQISALTAGHEQIETNVEKLRELAESIARDVTHTAQEQTELHRLVEDRSQAVTDNLQGFEKNQDILQTMMGELDRKTTEMAAENADSHQATSDKNEELTNQIGALLEGQQTVHTGVTGLDDKTNQIIHEIGQVIAEQVALIETLQAHAEAINAQISALHTDHKQLNSNANGLHELTRTVADGVVTISNEQAGVHQALQENSQALNANTHIAEQQQRTFQAVVNKVAETSQQIVATTTAMANEQAAFHETFKANNERFTEQASILSKNQQCIHAGIRNLDEKVSEISTEISSITDEQTNLHQHVWKNKNELTNQMQMAAQNLEKMQTDISELQQTNRMLFDTITALENMHETLKKEMLPKSNQTAVPLPPIPNFILQNQDSPTTPPTQMKQDQNDRKIQSHSQILPIVKEDNTKGIR